MIYVASRTGRWWNGKEWLSTEEALKGRVRLSPTRGFKSPAQAHAALNGDSDLHLVAN